MTYKIGLPDGRLFDVDDSVSEEEAEAQLMQRFPEQYPKAGGFVNATKAGAASGLGSLLRAGSEAADSFEGDTGFADWLKKKSKDTHNYANRTFVATPDSAEGVGNWTNRNILEPIGGMAGEFAPVMAASAGATAVGGPVAGIATFMAPRIATNYGKNVEYNESKGIENDPTANLVGSVATSILERFGAGRIVSGPVGAIGMKTAQREAVALAPRVIAGELSVKEAAELLPGFLKNAGANIIDNAGSNAAMMVGSSAAQRAQAGESLVDEDAMSRYGHDIKMAATLAPIFGGVHSGRGGAMRTLESAGEGFHKNFTGPDPTGMDRATEASRAAEYAEVRNSPTGDLISKDRPTETLPNPTEHMEAVIDPATQKIVGYKPIEKTPEQFALEQPSSQIGLFDEMPKQPEPVMAEAPRPLDKNSLKEAVPASQLRAKLHGVDENSIEGLQKIVDELKAYQYKIRNKGEESERFATAIPALAEKINTYERALVAKEGGEQAKAFLDLAPGERREAFTARPDVTSSELAPEKENVQTEPVTERTGDGVERGSEQPPAAVMDATPETERDRGSDGVAERDTQPTGVRDDTLTHDEAKSYMDELGVAGKSRVEALKDAALHEAGEEPSYDTKVIEGYAPVSKVKAPLNVEKEAAPAYGESISVKNKTQESAKFTGENELDHPNQYENRTKEDEIFDILKTVINKESTRRKPIVDAVSAEKGLNHVLDAIINVESDPALVEVAKALRKLNLDMGVFVDKEFVALGDAPKSRVEGLFTGSTVVLREKTATTSVILHEGMHAATHYMLEHPELLNKTQRKAVDALVAMHENIADDLRRSGHYGLKDVHEFIAEAFTNKKFQEELANYNYGDAAPKTLKTYWQAFVDSLSALLGVKDTSALAHVLSHTTRLFDAAEKRAEALRNNPRVPLGIEGGLEALLDRLQREGTRVESRTDITNETRFAETRKALMDDVEKRGTPPQTHKGIIKRISDFVKGVAGDAASAVEGVPRADMWTALKGWLSDKMYTIEQRFFDEFLGVTRYMPYGAFYIDGKGRRRLNPRSLLQKSNYATAIGEAALVYGKIARNSEGIFTAQKDEANLHALTDAAKKIPNASNPLQLTNSILMHLSQAEHEEIREEYRVKAEEMLSASKAKYAEAKKLSGSARDAAMGTARAMESQSKRLLEQTPEYKRPAGMTDESLAKVRELVATVPEIQAMLEINRKMNMNIIETLKQGGIITPERAEEWSQKKYYSPMFRVMDEQSLPSIGLRSNKPSEMKRFGGSERDVDVLSNHVIQTVWAADAVAKNQARIEAIKYFTENPELAKEIGLHRVEVPKGDNVVTVKVDGVDQHYNVSDTNAFRSLQGLKETLPGFMKPLEAVTHMFREAIMLSPGAMIRNFTRDPMEAFISSHIDENLVGAYTKAFKQMAGAMPNFRIGANPALAKIKDYGVFQHGITGVRELTKQDRELELILRRSAQEEGVQPGAGMLIDKIDSVLGRVHHKLQDVARAVEVSTREAVYQDALRRTGSEHEASLAAINTIDFRRRGDAGGITYARALIPFFNSQLQGVYKIYRTLSRNDNTGMTKENARAALAYKMMMMAGAAIAYHTLMDASDDDYKNIPMDIKSNNFVVPVGNGMHMRFAIPFEIGAAAWTIPVALADTAKGNSTYQELGKAIAGAVGNQMPSVIPVIAKPAIEHATNYDFFTGRNIETKAQQGVAAGERKNPDTTGIASSVGPAVGTSPVKFDHLFNGYFGSVGKHILGVVDATLGNNSGKPDTPWHRTQAGKVMFVDPDRTKQTDQFYDIHNKVSEVYNTAEHMKKEGNVPDLQKYLQDDSTISGMTNQQLYGYYQSTSNIAKQLGQLKQNEAGIRAAPSDKMTDEQKAVKLREKAVKLRELKLIHNTIVKQVAHPLRVAVGWDSQ